MRKNAFLQSQKTFVFKNNDLETSFDEKYTSEKQEQIIS